MASEPANLVINTDGAADGFLRTLEIVRNNGMHVPGDQSNSVGANQATRELVNFTVAIANPRQRLIRNSKYTTPITTAIARFVWMMAGNNRLADIAYYEPRVKNFSDDGLSVPGSNYGMRMVQPRPGLNQIGGIIDELRQHPSSRRATIAVYHPEDATRQDSSDIPCAFGLDYLIRDGRLLPTTIMRSNNAISLLPFNFFEFSLLAEVIAREVNADLGTMSHFAMSMHIYERDLPRAEQFITAIGEPIPPPMEPMPPNPMASINHLAQLEAELRHSGSSIHPQSIHEWINKANDPVLGPYWGEFYLVLLLHTARRVAPNTAGAVLKAIRAPLREFLPAADSQSGSIPASDPDLFGLGSSFRSSTVINILDTKRMRSLRKHVETHVSETGQDLPVGILWDLQDHFGSLAARGDAEISANDFAAALVALRSKKK